jgi:FAD/FMN-containing dehydrogenase
MNLNSLQTVVGPENVSASFEDRLIYNRDASRITGECLAVVWPIHLEQIEALVLWSHKHNVDLVPRGAGTGLCGGATPNKSVVVDLSRMALINTYYDEHKLIRVEPGVVLDKLNRYLDPHGLFLPVIPGSHQAASIGGMIATDAAGLRAVRYGKMRHWIEEITLLDGHGHIHNLSGKKLEDVIGREGVVGFIIEAVLRLAPLPEQRSVTIRAFDHLDDLMSERERWLSSQNLTALEYINSPASAAIGWDPCPHLLAEFDSSEGQITDLQQITQLWRARDSLYPVLARQGYPVIEDPKIVAPQQLEELLIWLERENISAFGHLGMGIVHPCFSPDDNRIDVLYQRVAELGGQVSGEHGIGLKKKTYTGEAFRVKIRQLKATYDPCDIFNRDKLC